MKWFRKIVDEREELEIRRIDSQACFIVLLGLGIAVIAQLFAHGVILEYIIGEVIVFFAGLAWAMVGYLRKGIWDYRTKPGLRAYTGYSLAAVLGYVILSLANHFRAGRELLTALKYTSVNAIILFIILFLILALFGAIIKRRRKKLEQKFDDVL